MNAQRNFVSLTLGLWCIVGLLMIFITTIKALPHSSHRNSYNKIENDGRKYYSSFRRKATRFTPFLGEMYTCYEKDILPQPRINMTDFMGLWKTLAHTLPPNEYLFESGITEHLHRVNNSFQVKYAGYFRNGCVGPSVLESWIDTNEPGWVHSDYYNEKREYFSSDSYRIMYTDNDYTILYSCKKVMADGKCDPSFPYIIINGKPDIEIDKDTWCDLLKYVRDKFCVYPHSVHIQSNSNDCTHKLDQNPGHMLPSNYTKTKHPSKILKKDFNEISRLVRKRRAVHTLKNIHELCLREI